MPISNYLKEIKQNFDSGQATEHSYRGTLQDLIKNLFNEIEIINEPQRIECGSPDYIVKKQDITIGYIEAKDIGINLRDTEKSEQIQRYLKSLGENFILTNYIDFYFYREKVKIKEISIAEIENGKVKPLKNHFEDFKKYIQGFCIFKGQEIVSPEELAKIMAQKARMMEEVLCNVLSRENSSLKLQFQTFKQVLIQDLDEQTFADIYAQTIAYGLFAAKLNSEQNQNFTRQNARDLISKTNPFLRSLFDYISGASLDEDLVWIVEALVDVFKLTDLREILLSFQKQKISDPFIHFYETFLAEYDPNLRKTRGVYYTPEAVVSFIVRSVDEILINEFNLSNGLADISKTKNKDKEFHKVQILDPAAGTGTFLSMIVKEIHKKFINQKGIWNNFVEEHLIPRLNGFEILMAPYAMCHLKLEMLLKETGYKLQDKSDRLKVFLTNSLEPPIPPNALSFVDWLVKESEEASKVKEESPIMVIIGNPPYSGESQNKGEHIMNLMEDYKKEPGGKEKLKERNPKWINDDYVKFIRFSQDLIEKNGEGIIAFVNNHSFLDNPTFRGMRWNLLQTFNKIYVLDLHGNAKKKELSPDGSVDQNVFDIQQGVSINIFIKKRDQDSKLAKVFHFDLFGKRENKYKFLRESSLNSIKWQKLNYKEPQYFFVSKDFEFQNTYDKGFSVVDLFKVNSVGIVTAKDIVLINTLKKDLLANVQSHYNIKPKENLIKTISYRPFDKRLVYFDTNLIERSRENIMRHFIKGENLGFVFTRFQFRQENPYAFAYLTKYIIDINSLQSPGTINVAPLYLYPEKEKVSLRDNEKSQRTPNFHLEIVNQIAKKINLKFTEEKTNSKNSFAPIDILDYIYAVLHSPNYREKFKEFLKIDFPKIPYPKNQADFLRLVRFGEKLRKIHLLEEKSLDKSIVSYPKVGSNIVEKVEYQNNKVFINKEQYFDKVPKIAWEFFIGGYQPAQKYLKDRKGKELSFDEITHYQKIIKALFETHKIMQEIDKE